MLYTINTKKWEKNREMHLNKLDKHTLHQELSFACATLILRNKERDKLMHVVECLVTINEDYDSL